MIDEYRFKIETITFMKKEEIEKYASLFKEKHDEERLSEVTNKLNEIMEKDGVLDGTAIQELFFPKGNYDIFLSHSHQDKNEVLALAQFFQNHNLNVFVDSIAWEHSDIILRTLDEKYSKKEKGLYDYKKSNYNASIVYSMLSMALYQMIYNTPCIMFYDTNNSISLKDLNAEERTQSPWIYQELNAMSLIREKEKRRMQESVEFSDREKVNVSFIVDTSQLPTLSNDELQQWAGTVGDKKGMDALKHLASFAKND